jgi:hypothetical protein
MYNGCNFLLYSEKKHTHVHASKRADGKDTQHVQVWWYIKRNLQMEIGFFIPSCHHCLHVDPSMEASPEAGRTVYFMTIVAITNTRVGAHGR